MNDTSDDPPLIDRIRSWARSNAHASNFNPFGRDEPSLPLAESNSTTKEKEKEKEKEKDATAHPSQKNRQPNATNNDNGGLDEKASSAKDSAPESSQAEGEKSSTVEEKPHVMKRFYLVGKTIIFSSWVNVLLIFVPVGIALGALREQQGDDSSISPTVVFAINCIAIIPLAALLAYATESVASKMGDTVGALMNVTFGNAVELIIFIIALVAKEIRIVQASILGSILSNLLLILGMCFLFGGLRFREQLYNANVTQMSACLLSLAVMTLVLPTAFHASFNNTNTADAAVIKVSRGTSVILLLIYVLYLLFQLKSHAFMYESTPQYKIDEESHPGLLADILHSSSSSSDSSSSSGTDSDSSSGSHTTAKRIKRALRRRRHRKSSASSKEAPSLPSFVRTSSSGTNAAEEIPVHKTTSQPSPGIHHGLEALVSGDEADTDGEHDRQVYFDHDPAVTSRDFETELHRSASVSRASTSEKMTKKQRKVERKASKKKRRHRRHSKHIEDSEAVPPKSSPTQPSAGGLVQPGPRVEFAPEVEQPEEAGTSEAGLAGRRPFLRNLSRPAMPKVLSQSVFSQSNQSGPAMRGSPALPARSGLRRTSSLPDRLNKQSSIQSNNPANPLPYFLARNPSQAVETEAVTEEKKHLSKTSAVLLLLISTGLVAACAEFLVDSIDYLVSHTGVSQAFVGLVILPIVGNAAEHITAVTVASKNKMDLAIGVAIGSSLQIALFVTPLVVLLGWILDRDMSLYFSLFETVSLFVSAFIVNFLVLDGRSNYLEGALLIAAYVIIATAAFFYPSCADQSGASGPSDGSGSC